MAIYGSSIPASAIEVVTRCHPNGKKEAADYFLNDQKIGVRYWYENNQLEFDWGLIDDGSRNGYEYEFALYGQITFKSRHINGREHGTARQWNDRGDLLVT